ncbi:homoserine dehydrogenase [bacterium LRH843]|nr:homoserine dehydrogenase [bacterium LRH843]
MSVIHVALLGYGTVGKGVYKTVETHQKRLKTLLGKEVKIVAILVNNIKKHRSPHREVLLTNDFTNIINLEKLDVVIDAISGKRPSFTYLEQAINRGCHVITANKEMFAHYGKQLKQLANEKDVTVGFEATVAGGIPIIQTLKQLVNVNKVEKVEGILNGTSNFILTQMREEALSFDTALTLAQENGYAEADPTNDIEGYDAFYKAMILCELVFGETPNWKKAIRTGITSIRSEQMDIFSSLHLRFKHVASLERAAEGIKCTVKPVLVHNTHPFYQVEGVQNAVSIDADIVGNISLHGPGAGMFPTASAILEDLVHIGKAEIDLYSKRENEQKIKQTTPIWAICGDLNPPSLHASFQIIEKPYPNVLFVKAKESTMSILDDTGIDYYQILGEVESKELVQS